MAFWDFLTRLLQTSPRAVDAGDGAAEATAAVVESVVLVTDFENDSGAVSDAVVDALRSVRGVVARRVGGSCGVVDDGEVLPVTLAEATRLARRGGLSRGAQAVIFGQVMGATVRLRFVPTQLEGDPGFSTLLPGDFIDLPLPFGERGDLIPACAVAALACPGDAARKQRLDRLRGLIVVADRQCQALAAAGSAHAAASASLCYAAMLAEVGFRADDPEQLRQSLEIIRASLARGKDQLTSAQVASARARFGDIQMKFGGEDRSNDLLEEAAHHFRLAADVFTVETFPEEFALLRAQAGRALHRLGVNSGKTTVMKEAVQSYFEATKVWTKGANPDRWAEMQQGMGAVMSHLGEFSGNAEILGRACKIFEGAAEVWSKEKAPRRWAGLMNNIGACRFAQGKRSGDLPVLREASESFAKALEVYSAMGMNRNVFVTQKNLARVDRLISVQEGRE